MDIEKEFTQCGSYTLLKTLGAGFHAKVKLAEARGQYFAIKVFKNNHALATNIQALANEIKIMQNLNHPNLVNLIEFNESMPYQKKNGIKESRVCIVIELAQGGELFEYVAQTGKFSEETCRFYFKQLLESLSYMHSKGIAHRDLKPENLLFDQNYNLKVADFGFSALVSKYSDGKLRTILGTEGYKAPEINAEQPYDGKQVDIFASAIILFIMFAGSPPFSRADTNDPYYKLISNNKNEVFWKVHAKNQRDPNFFSEEFKNLVDAIFQQDPSKRPPIEKILEHPWMTGQTNTSEQIQAEFKMRKMTVDSELQKEKLRKQAEKQKQGNQGTIHTGFGQFRGIDKMDQDFSEIIKKYELTDSRDLRNYDNNAQKQNDFFTVLDQDYLLKLLLSKQSDLDCEVLKLSKDKYKFTVRSVDEDNKILDLDIEFRKVDEEIINVNFMKKEGEHLQYYEKLTKSRLLFKRQVNEQLIDYKHTTIFNKYNVIVESQ